MGCRVRVMVRVRVRARVRVTVRLISEHVLRGVVAESTKGRCGG